MIFTTLTFKRTHASKVEDGYAIGKDVGDIVVIVDSRGEIVQPPVWTFKISTYPTIFIQHEYSKEQTNPQLNL